MSIKDHVLYELLNCPVRRYPYPHFFCENVFPDAFYREILEKLPADDQYKESEGRYRGRAFCAPIPEFSFFDEKDVARGVMSIFHHDAKKRFPDGIVEIRTDLRLLRDRCGYEIGPHTDAPWKIISLIFYLPTSPMGKAFGTSIYRSKDPDFKCAGGPHWNRENFDLVYTVPYLPNSCFGFWKSDHSWHGVEPITSEIQRDSLLYNIYLNIPQKESADKSQEQKPE